MNINQENQNESTNNSEIISKLNETISLQKSQLEQQKKSSNYAQKIVITLFMVLFVIPTVVNSCSYLLTQ